MGISLKSIVVENLRDYKKAELFIDRSTIVLVGKNNSGKTSILKLLDWVLNKLDIEKIRRSKSCLLSEEEKKIILPARDVGHSARRLLLRVAIDDGRRRKRFKCDSRGVASLRINIRMTPRPFMFIKLGDPKRSEPVDSDPAAIELLKELRKNIIFIHVPSFRDANSKRFTETLTTAFQDRLSERALHDERGGAPAEYRTIKKTISELKNVATDLTNPLWVEVKKHLPPGLAHDATIEFNCEPEDLINWIAKRLELRVTTGEHDKNKVDTIELSSGLQSLLDLAIQRSSSNSNDKQIMMAIEEPEAFLYPSAQRTLARLIMNDSRVNFKIITTHSPFIIEEVSYGDVVLVRDHEFFFPSDQVDEDREEINTALMSGMGAELMFATGVLFVEGDGDRQFFEMLRRRIAKIDESGKIDDLMVAHVGSKTRFGPWLRLVLSYGKGENRPIRFLAVADSDATDEVRRGFRDAGYNIPSEIDKALSEIKTVEPIVEKHKKVIEFNRKCRVSQFPLRFLPIDLEFAILNSVSDEVVRNIACKLKLSGIRTKDELLRHFGSKGVERPIKNGQKAPWMRGIMGRDLPWNELSNEIKNIIKDWLSLVFERKEANSLVNKMNSGIVA